MKKIITVIIFTFLLTAGFSGAQAATVAPSNAEKQIVPAVKTTGKAVYRGGHYVGKKTWRGGRYVGLKVARSGKWVAVKTARGVKWVFVGNKRSRKP